MIKKKAMAAALVAATLPVLVFGSSGTAFADGTVTWKNGTHSQTEYLNSDPAGGDVRLDTPPESWQDIQNSDGTWNEVDAYGRCLTGYGQHAYTEPCNSGRDGTNSYERWREIWMGSGNGFKLQNVQSGYFLDFSGNFGPGGVYLNSIDYNNANQRWY